MKAMVRKVIAYTKVLLKTKTAYKAELVMSLLSFPVYLGVLYFLWTHVYVQTSMPMGFESLMVYYSLIYFFGAIIPGRNIFSLFENGIRRGGLAAQMLRPLNLLAQMVSRPLSSAVFNMVAMLPILVAALWFFSFVPSIVNVLVSAWLIAIAFFIAFFLFCAFAALAFWLERSRGLLNALQSLVKAFAGTIVPLSFLPGWFQDASVYLPFRFMASVPANAFLGNVPLSEVLTLSVIGIFWVVVTYSFAVWVLGKGLKRYTGYGV